jgi:hypothetical protein
MNLILAEYTYQTATETFDCEACKMFWSIAKPDYKGIEFSDILLFYKAKSGKVKQGQRYLQLTFLERDTEELLEINVHPAMHKFMYKMGFYPDFMQDALLEYKRNFKKQALTT